jgi:diaminopimelate decarboxylase
LIENNKPVRLLLRVNPEVHVETDPSIATGVQGSKFGTPIRSALPLIRKLHLFPYLTFLGLHCHIGSKIYDFRAYSDALYQMFQFIAHLKSLNIPVPVVNIGGGLGINTLACSQEKIRDWVQFVTGKVIEYCQKWSLDLPVLAIEPGRSIVEQAGLTMYRVGHVKEEENEWIVAVNGGMTDNIRPYLFDAVYHAVLPDRMSHLPHPKPCRIVGNCCESGDVLIPQVFLPECQVGDALAVLNTGAYCHSLASVYNKYCMPSIVFVNETGVPVTVTQASSFEQLIQNDDPDR